MKNGRDILLVEDDTVDHMLVRRALAELRIPNRLEIAASGEKALSYLRDETNPRPGIIVLDHASSCGVRILFNVSLPTGLPIYLTPSWNSAYRLSLICWST